LSIQGKKLGQQDVLMQAAVMAGKFDGGLLARSAVIGDHPAQAGQLEQVFQVEANTAKACSLLVSILTSSNSFLLIIDQTARQLPWQSGAKIKSHPNGMTF
jgi:hypothetical protein